MSTQTPESIRINEIEDIYEGDVPEYIFLEDHQSGKNRLVHRSKEKA